MAQFKTGANQREIVLDVKVAADYKVGDMVSLANGTITKTNTLAKGNYIIAQSDTTMEYGHVPVEHRNWMYSDKVAASTTPKKVAVFLIFDETDIII